MALKTVFWVIGLLLMALSAMMFLPLLITLEGDTSEWSAFLISASITGFIGVLMALSNLQAKEVNLGVREAFILTVLSWLFVSVFASLPFMFGHRALSFTDALFEATSALTTTGASVIKNLDKASAGILLWRALLQWLGGVGIIVMALTVLPILKIGGMQLFRTESSDRSEKILPRISQLAIAILFAQAVFVVVIASALWGAGMSCLEAFCHAMSSLATGGFSTSDSSVAHFQSPLIEIILMISMIIGSCSIVLFIRAWHGDWSTLFRDRQVRGFIFIVGLSSVSLALWRFFHTDAGLATLLRESSFAVISLITTTGFTSGDYSKWGDFANVLAFLLVFVGGCTGSTSGGLKIFRFQVLFAVVKTQIAQLRRPHGVFIPHYNNQPISESVINSVFTFFALFGLTYGSIALLLGMCGLDPLTSLSAASSALCNAGTGIGVIINPCGSYASIPEGAKWVLMLGMFLGRLELVTVFAVLTPAFWKK